MEIKNKKKYNTNVQYYKGIPIKLIVYTEKHFNRLKAKRFILGNSNQNIWIPNIYLTEDGTIKKNANIDFIFKQAFYQKKLQYANIEINPLNW